MSVGAGRWPWRRWGGAGVIVLTLGAPAPASGSSDSSTGEPVAAAGTDVSGVIADSLRLLAIEHLTRVSGQAKTRRELGGPFWSDYRRSVRIPGQWGDSDGWFINYVGHPVHGAAAGFIWLRHDPQQGVHGEFGRAYWLSRLRATAWSAGYSLQFELGPLSEASIGNVGKDPATTGWVDHVVTPAGGLGLMLAEDAVDRFVLSWIERRVEGGVWRATMRTVLNPARALANLAGGRPPWHRHDRQLTGRAGR